VVRFISKKGKQFKKELNEAYLNSKCLNYKDKELEIEMKLYFGDRRKHDGDNCCKAICDSLNGVAYNDDSQIRRYIVEKYYDKENPRIELQIKQFEGEVYDKKDTRRMGGSTCTSKEKRK